MLVDLLDEDGEDEDMVKKIIIDKVKNKIPIYYQDPDHMSCGDRNHSDYQHTLPIDLDSGEHGDLIDGKMSRDKKMLLFHWKDCPLDNDLAKVEIFYGKELIETLKKLEVDE